MAEIKIEINCNGEYCGDCDHVFCKPDYDHNKEIYMCQIFNKQFIKRRIKKGYLDFKRCKDCLKAEKKN